jgi:hypothetical protein
VRGGSQRGHQGAGGGRASMACPLAELPCANVGSAGLLACAKLSDCFLRAAGRLKDKTRPARYWSRPYGSLSRRPPAAQLIDTRPGYGCRWWRCG